MKNVIILSIILVSYLCINKQINKCYVHTQNETFEGHLEENGYVCVRH